jgi:hypothetical protein
MANKKILYVIGAIALGGSIYFTIRYIKIVKAYKRNLNQNDALQVIADATKNIPAISPNEQPTINDDNVNSGITLGQINEDAVMINGVIYIGDANSGYYISKDVDGGYTYDDNTGTMYSSNGTFVANIPASIVTYGTYDPIQDSFSAN